MRWSKQYNSNNKKHTSLLTHSSIKWTKVFAFVFFLIAFIIFPSKNSIAQVESDSIFLEEAHVVEVVDTAYHSPKRAGWLSTAIPGLGQAYNKKYWKIPVIYVAFGTITYFLVKHNGEYIKYRDAYIARIDDDPSTIDDLPEYTTENLRVYKNAYWKSRDLDIILLAGVFTLNILDAIVDAHFYTYDISDDLSLQVTPVVAPALRFGPSKSSYAGLSFTLSF
ncbi:MAG: hypothetical protein KAG64_02130 [Bacteroidales bacterium]|nr:hypothetical protein [Bacteroidales bacterium]